MGSGTVRTRRGVVVVGMTVVLAAGAAACGSESGGPASSPTGPPVTVTAPADAGAAYVRALDESTRAMAGVVTATLDPTVEQGARAPLIEAELVRLETTADLMAGLSLPDPEVDAQRRSLLEAIPPFTVAMRDVVAAGTEDPVNGGLELVQRREPILAGFDAVLAADAGAIRALGEEAEAALSQARGELERRLDDLRTQAAR